MGFPRKEYWSGLPLPPPGDFPKPGIEPTSLALQADSLLLELSEKPTPSLWWLLISYLFGWGVRSKEYLPVESEATELVLAQQGLNSGRVQNFKLYLCIEPLNAGILATSDWLTPLGLSRFCSSITYSVRLLYSVWNDVTLNSLQATFVTLFQY